MFSQIKAYLYGGAALVVVGLVTTIWVQSARIDNLKKDVEQARTNMSVCLAANADGQKTIAELKKERERAGKSCAKQIADKNKLIDELRKIDEATGGGNVSNNGSADNAVGSGNTILAILNGMLPGQGGRADGVCKAGNPTVAAGAPLVSSDVLYCLDEVNAKNLAKDWALCKAWAIEGVQLLDGLRTIEKKAEVAR